MSAVTLERDAARTEQSALVAALSATDQTTALTAITTLQTAATERDALVTATRKTTTADAKQEIADIMADVTDLRPLFVETGASDGTAALSTLKAWKNEATVTLPTVTTARDAALTDVSSLMTAAGLDPSKVDAATATTTVSSLLAAREDALTALGITTPNVRNRTDVASIITTLIAERNTFKDERDTLMAKIATAMAAGAQNKATAALR